jgi:Mannosyltransferase (PIG-V)
MPPDTAEMAVVDTADALAAPAVPEGGPAALTGTSTSPPSAVRVWQRWRADAARMAAVRDTWRALWVSRLLIWAAGVGAVAAFGLVHRRNVFDPPHITSGFGWLGDLLAAPAARWDAAWYLVIAHYGYHPELGAFTSSRTAFFPLYPLGLRTISQLGLPPVAAGVALSLAALAAGLYGIHRLTTLELGRLTGIAGRGGGTARLAVLLVALSPMAFYLSAVYSESLYLALSVGVFWCARRGRWAWVGVLGALAGATRSAGLVLAVPVLILYLYGPRDDRPPDLPERPTPPTPGGDRAGGVARARARWLARARARLRPRYRLRRDVLWLGLLPAGVAAYMAYLALAGGDALMPFHAQEVWNRRFAGPYVGVWDGARAAFDGVRQLLSSQTRHVYFTASGEAPMVSAGHNTVLFVFLVAAVPAIVGVLRRLPIAYGAYVLAALALPLSYPVAPQPLMSLPRFELVLFPLFMWLAACALLLATFVGEFATWHWVA